MIPTTSRIARAITITGIEFTPVGHQDAAGDLLGHVTFIVNGFILFEHLPVRSGRGGLRIELPHVPGFLAGEVRREVERQILLAAVEARTRELPVMAKPSEIPAPGGTTTPKGAPCSTP